MPLRRPTLTAWAGGPKARALAGLPQPKLRSIAVDSLAELLRVHKGRVLKLLTAFHAYDWAADPWSRGAYSYVAVGGMGARRRLAEPVDHTLFFAGEATDTSGQASTVAGALLSGQRAARQVLASL
jgi:monoamine oxidase